jgi:biofilm PGA synthesis protein PgaD
MKAEAIIIHRPERQAPARRALFAVLTLGAWFVWVSLWLPLITLVAWLFGMRTSYVELFVREHGNGLSDLLVVVAIGVCCGLIEILWSSYNFRRFRHATRRRARPLVGLDAMAESLLVAQPSAVHLREQPRTVLQFADDGTIRHLAEG